MPEVSNKTVWDLNSNHTTYFFQEGGISMADKREKRDFASLRNDGRRILARGESTSNNTWETGRNNNDLIIGPTGSGKTRYYVKPNLLSASESLIVTDTKGNLHRELRPALEEAGYEVLLLDLSNPEQSIGYNPFDYIACDRDTGEYSQKDIATFAGILYGQAQDAREPFWDESAKALLRILIAAVLEATVEEDHNIHSLHRLFEKIEIGREERSPYGVLMDDLRAQDPESYAASQYAMAISEQVERTANCIRMFAGTKLAALEAKEIDALLRREERIDILQLARKKTALFVTISDTDRSQDMLANLFYTQALHTLCRYADEECMNSCLPVPVRFILDDFATNACIPDFDNLISVIRSRGIAVSIILQSQTQLEKMYGQAAATTILNGCDTVLYLGGQDLSTAGYIGTRVNHSDFKVLTMPLSKVWLLQRGEEPKLVRRYELTEHPRYGLLPEAKAAQNKEANKGASKGANERTKGGIAYDKQEVC